MILQLATKHQRLIAFGFLYLLLFSYTPKLYAGNIEKPVYNYSRGTARTPGRKGRVLPSALAVKPTETAKQLQKVKKQVEHILNSGGPTQPEMSTFKSVSANSLVDLFTGDFNYNIPLLDVGGYPVNIFYSGNISMDQEASWTGLGWNINPGTITRNMRGVPDDFDGHENLTEIQNMKPNITFGAKFGGSFELNGIKNLHLPSWLKKFDPTLGGSLGMSFNNYLGPAIDLGIQGGAQFQIANKVMPEKSSTDTSSLALGLNLNVGGSVTLGSRDGVTITPNVSLGATAALKDRSVTSSLGLSTSYNSRSGIKELQISEQMSYNKDHTPKSRYDDGKAGYSATLASNSITFAKPSYIPAIRMPVTNTAFSGRFQLGLAIFGVSGTGELEVYKQKAEVAEGDVTQKKPLVGYLYYQNAKDNDNAVMDFSRLNDREVTSHTPVISAPQYTYDVFSIQGEGTGGSFRAYRTEASGYVRDNFTQSKDKNLGLGADVGLPGHFGGSFNLVKTPSTIGDWGNGNVLHSYAGFTPASGLHEAVYFRNPGETSVLNPGQYDSIGGTDLVRYQIGGAPEDPVLEPTLLRYSKDHKLVSTKTFSYSSYPTSKPRVKRSQVISFLTAGEASEAGLDKQIENYSSDEILKSDNTLNFTTTNRVDGNLRRENHISQIDVLEGNGKRYIYGLPVYNIVQKDYTFSVQEKSDKDNTVNADLKTEMNSGAPLKEDSRDGYYQERDIPGYAHSFLLTGLLSPDYVDVTGNGITEDDLGNAVKFNYTQTEDHRWKTPYGTNLANFNDGNLTNDKDDKGIISYGERESWYLHSIESKTMIAIFKMSSRSDGCGTKPFAGQEHYFGDGDENNPLYRLDRIDLYSKADLKANGLSARPIKSVHFDYSYDLCRNTKDNLTRNDETNRGGKLTLKGISFYFNGQTTTTRLNQYRFAYSPKSAAVEPSSDLDNPDYQFNASDRWNTYKPSSANPAGISNAIYPYAIQDNSIDKTTRDSYASAWALKKISLPSGGLIQVNYESDDYAYVQNRRAADMMSIAGFGSKPDSRLGSYNMYDNNGLFTKDETGDIIFSSRTNNDYVFIDAGQECTQDIVKGYLDGLGQLAFRLGVNMPKGVEYMTAYASIKKYGVYESNPRYFWIEMEEVDGLSPLSLTAIEYLREQLPAQAYPAYDISDDDGLERVGHMLVGMLDGIAGAFSDPVNHLLNKGKAKTVDAQTSFIRLNDADGYKYGGGQRVSSVTISDNWDKMTDQYASVYGQKYTYETTEIYNGKERTISSGVASYEPSIGSEENPFRSIIRVANKLPLGPTNYGAVEMPVLDAFFPVSVVGYSKVTVQSVKRTKANTNARSKTGKQVTEFYTAKDFPSYYSNTSFDPSCDRQGHTSELTFFFYKEAFDSRALSQGFLVATNDMHGKMKSQATYAETDDNSPTSYTENFYRNTGVNGMDETFDFVNASKGGTVEKGNMGIDVELMTDVREFSVQSNSLDIQGQLDLYPVFFPFWFPFIWPVVGNSENTYRAVTATKVINYHSILDHVLVIDKGSQVSTQNEVYDAETGNVVVSRTNNEFDKPVYTTTYPAYWAYSGMGLAYKNIGAAYTAGFSDGKVNLTSSRDNPETVFESGDELLILKGDAPTSGCDAKQYSSADKIIWAFDKTKDQTSLTTKPDFIFIDKNGRPYTRENVSFKIVRSGKRNILDASASSVTTMTDPVRAEGEADGIRKISIDEKSKTVATSALLYKEKWQNDKDVFSTYKSVDATDGKNLINNSYFEQGNTGFHSDYKSNYENSAYGQYYVAPTWNNIHDGLQIVSDHTTGGSNLMFIDGTSPGDDDYPSDTKPADYNGEPRVWYETITVQPNTQYELSAWIYNRSDKKPPNLKFKIDYQINNSSYGVVWLMQFTPDDKGRWKQFSGSWTSGNVTTAAITIIDLNNHGYGNDFALDDITFRAVTSCTPSEVFDCDGYLEKQINPYRKGLLGNFRSFQNMVYYGDRTEKETGRATNLPENGFLADFKKPYWNFDESNHLVPDNSNPKWTWNTQSTKFNSRGLELENKNALGIYTAAQYGYQKSIPVAVTNNARYDESLFEGFEDYDFDGSVNQIQTAQTCVNNRYSDFSAAGIIEASDFGLAAHTGKYMIQIEQGATLKKSFMCASPDEQPFSLVMRATDLGNLINPGVSVEKTQTDYPNDLDRPSNLANHSSATALSFTGTQTATVSNDGYETQSYQYTSTHYLQVFECGDYKFFTSSKNFNGGCNSLVLQVYDANENLIPLSYLTSINSTAGDYYYMSYLEKGIYRVKCIFNGGGTKYYSNGYNHTDCGFQAVQFWNMSATNLESQADLPLFINTQTGCTYTKPMPAAPEMFNSVFTVPYGKKMLFSCWIRENCDFSKDNSCPKSSVALTFSNGYSQNVTLHPIGPVIEGWQKCEGEFTTPPSSGQEATMTLNFTNNSDQSIYVDDIRIHPYNANMKSYVYDPVNLRLTSELDENNYATFYEYDDEGTLIRVKAETKDGIKTIKETRSALQQVAPAF